MCRASISNRRVMKLGHVQVAYMESMHIKFGDPNVTRLDVVCIASALRPPMRQCRGEVTLKLCHTKSFDRLARKLCHIAFAHMESIQTMFGDLNMARVGRRQNASQLLHAQAEQLQTAMASSPELSMHLPAGSLASSHMHAGHDQLKL